MNTRRQINIAEGHMLDALEKGQEMPPHLVIYAGLRLLGAAALSNAPDEESANELISLALADAGEFV